MSGIKLLQILQIHKLRIFSTRDILALSQAAPSAVTQGLFRLEKEGMVTRLKRGIWINRWAENLNSFEAVPALTAPWPGYVSLHSVLADYGIIEEIPQIVYAVSAHLPEKRSTAIGTFHIHHLHPRLIWGFEIRQSAGGTYPIAEPEKAFLDIVYLSLVPRSPIRMVHKRGRKWGLDPAKLKEYAKRFEYPPMIRWLKENGI